MKETKNAKVKDLKVKEEKTKQVKGGFNPQPEPPGVWKPSNPIKPPVIKPQTNL